MSNCVHILDTLILEPEVFDVEGFIKRAKEVEADPLAKKSAPDDDSPESEKLRNTHYWWWLLSSNWKQFASGAVIVYLGQGRSSHTDRDLRWALIQIGKFIKVEGTVVTTLRVKDEYDGFRQTFREKFDLRTGLTVK